MIMKIYVTGSHSCGKTTLSRYISTKYGLKLINEVARTVLAEKELNLESLRANIDVVNDFQKSVFLRQIEEENKYDNFVSDRSFDNLAYAIAHSTIFHEIIDTKELKDYIVKLKQKEVVIFFIRPNKATMKDDGVRETVDWDGVIAIDSMVKVLLEMFDLKYINVNTGSMQERVRLIDSVISLTRQND